MRQSTAAARALLLGALALAVLALGACGDDDQPSLETFCARLETAYGPQGALAADYSGDPSAAEAVVEELEAVRQVAPLEIEPSLAIVNEIASLIIAGFSGTEVANLEAEQLEEIDRAATELVRYSAEHCGLDLNRESPVVLVEPDKIPGEVPLDVRG